MSKEDEEFKEKPDNINVFRRLDFLEREWGKRHLKVEENQVIILDNNGTELIRLPINTQVDSHFLRDFYGI